MQVGHARELLLAALTDGFAEFVEGPHRVTVWDDDGQMRWQISGVGSQVVFADGTSVYPAPAIVACAAAIAELSGDGDEAIRQALATAVERREKEAVQP